MGLYLDFPSGWWLILAILYIPYFILFFARKSYQSKKEIKHQLILALIVASVSFPIDFMAVSLRIWTFFPNNFPVVLFPAYFGAALLGYQILKKIEEVVK